MPMYIAHHPPDVVEVQILGTQWFREVCVVLVVKLADAKRCKKVS